MKQLDYYHSTCSHDPWGQTQQKKTSPWPGIHLLTAPLGAPNQLVSCSFYSMAEEVTKVEEDIRRAPVVRAAGVPAGVRNTTSWNK